MRAGRGRRRPAPAGVPDRLLLGALLGAIVVSAIWLLLGSSAPTPPLLPGAPDAALDLSDP